MDNKDNLLLVSRVSLPLGHYCWIIFFFSYPSSLTLQSLLCLCVYVEGILFHVKNCQSRISGIALIIICNQRVIYTHDLSFLPGNQFLKILQLIFPHVYSLKFFSHVISNLQTTQSNHLFVVLSFCIDLFTY